MPKSRTHVSPAIASPASVTAATVVGDAVDGTAAPPARTSIARVPGNAPPDRSTTISVAPVALAERWSGPLPTMTAAIAAAICAGVSDVTLKPYSTPPIATNHVSPATGAPA